MPANDATDHDNSALLSDATLSTLHLQHQPFTALSPDSSEQDTAAEAPFSDAITEEQLADIKQALITGDDLLLVLGEPGAGKSTLLKQLNANSGLRIQCFPVEGNERFKTLTLFSGMLEAFHQQPPTKLKDLLDELIPYLQSMVARNTLCTIVLDDAHKVKKEELTQLLSGMLYMNSQDETLVRIALAATEEFEETIPELLPEGADLPYSSLTIEGLSTPRAAAFIDYRLQMAGFDQEFPFTERDMDSLVEHSAGRPAQLQALTANVLNEKYGRLDDLMPDELTAASSSGFLQSRFGKLALGALAALLIIGGLLMFLPSNDASRPGTTTTTVAINNQNQSDEAAESQLADTQTVTNNAAQEVQDAASEVNDTVTDALTDNNSDTDTAAAQSAADATSSAPIESEVSSQITIVAENGLATDGETDAANDAIEAAEQAADNTIIQAPEEAATLTQTANQSTANSSAGSPEAESAQAPNTNDTNDTEVAENTDNTPGEADTSSESINAEEELAATEPGEQASEAEEAVETPAPIDDSLGGLLESPTWILVQDVEKYTIQMSASRDLESVQDFLRRNPLPPPNSIFSFERNGDTWYALVHGTFDGLSEAREAVERMSESAQRDQPWIRSIARVKAALRQP